ncbi:MAG: ABC transporter substrate-binding protein [Clostridium sp.]
MDEAANGESENSYEFTMVTAADEMTAMVAGGKVDIALLPANVASVLYNKTNKNISVIDINTLGVLYFVSADSSVTTIDQLKGKTVYLPGKGTTPEYALRYVLSAAGLGEDDVTLEFKSEASEVASVLAEDPNAIGLLPQPFVTAALAQNEKLSIIMDLTKEWDNVQGEGSGSRLVTGVTIVNNDFLKEHEDLVDTFLQEHEASIAFTAESGCLSELIDEIVAKPDRKRPYCNITFISGDEMKTALSGYLQALYDQNPASVGGELPDDSFYYVK